MLLWTSAEFCFIHLFWIISRPHPESTMKSNYLKKQQMKVSQRGLTIMNRGSGGGYKKALKEGQSATPTACFWEMQRGQMAGSSVHSLGLAVQDTQPSQACNGRQGTAGRDQTLQMDEGVFFFRSRSAWNRESERRTTTRGNTVQNTLRDLLEFIYIYIKALFQMTFFACAAGSLGRLTSRRTNCPR